MKTEQIEELIVQRINKPPASFRLTVNNRRYYCFLISNPKRINDPTATKTVKAVYPQSGSKGFEKMIKAHNYFYVMGSWRHWSEHGEILLLRHCEPNTYEHQLRIERMRTQQEETEEVEF